LNGTNCNEGQPEYKPLDFGDVLKRAFDLYKENLGLLIVVHLVGGLPSLCTIGILAGPLYAGVSLVMLALYDRKDPKPVVGDLFKGFDFFLPAFLLFLVVCAVMIPVSMITGPLSSIAGLVAGTVTMFSYFLIVERKNGFLARDRGKLQHGQREFLGLSGAVCGGLDRLSAGIHCLLHRHCCHRPLSVLCDRDCLSRNPPDRQGSGCFAGHGAQHKHGLKACG
jgi:hypothetical protein